MSFIQEQNQSIMGEISKLNRRGSVNSGLHGDPCDNVKVSVNSFLETRDKQTNSFGSLNPFFDAEKVGRNICSFNNANYSVFCYCVKAIDDDVFSLDDFNRKSFDELGISEVLSKS